MTSTKRIKSLSDFKAERRRLKAEIAEKELILKEDFTAFHEAIKPLNVATKWASKFFVTKDKNFVNTGMDTAITFLLRNVLLSRAGWLTKLVVPYIAKNYANNKLSENKADIVHTVREWLHNFQAKRRQRMNGHYDRSTADINL